MSSMPLINYKKQDGIALFELVVPPGKASKAVGRIKRAVCSGLEMPFSEGLALEREPQPQLFISNDAKEGIAAHVEKRKPDFTGR